MHTSNNSILFVADQPWQIRIFRSVIQTLAIVNPDLECEILISDYYTFLHQKDLLHELERQNIRYKSMSRLFECWQEESEPRNLYDKKSSLEDFFDNAQTFRRLEKTNQWIYGDERNKFYLPMSDTWKERIFLDTVSWCIDSIVEISPSMIITLERATLPNNAIYEISRKMDIPHRCFIPSRIDNYWYIRNDFGRSLDSDFAKEVKGQEYSLESISKVNLWVENFLVMKLGSYRSLEESLINDLPRGQFSDIFGYAREFIALAKKAYARLFERKRFDFKIRRLEQDLVKLTYIQFRQFLLKSLFSVRIWNPFDDFNGRERYFLWALHARPEGSVLALNNGRDEIEQLSELSQILPEGVVLLVKENIEMLGLRRTGFYKSISRDNNIRILSPKANLANLIPECSGIVGISGTFLLEGAIYGKPVFALGDPEFKYFLSNSSLQTITEFVTAALSNGIAKDVDSVKKYLAYIFEFGFDFGFSMFDNEATKPNSKIVEEIVRLVSC